MIDGNAECDAILARLQPLAGGRIFEGVPDDKQIPKDGMGRVLPYISVHFGEPILQVKERTMAGGDGTQPYILPVSLQLVAPSEGILRKLGSAARALLVDWAPSATSGTMQPTGGMAFPTQDTSNRTSRYNRIAHYPVTINL